MKRRSALKLFGGAGRGIAAGLASGPGPLQAAQTTVRRGLPPLKITDVKVILAVGPDQLVIVRYHGSRDLAWVAPRTGNGPWRRDRAGTATSRLLSAATATRSKISGNPPMSHLLSAAA
jgi:hypothetical protein